jgi:hypothetical protein
MIATALAPVAARDLQRIADPLQAASPLLGLEQRLKLVLGLRGLANRLDQHVLLDVVDLRERSDAALRSGDKDLAARLAQTGDAQLVHALADEQLRVAGLERAAAADLFAGALADIGCATDVVGEGGFDAVVGRRGHQVVGALIEDGGRLTFEIAGCDGLECAPLQHEIEQAVVRRGGTLEGVRVADHRDARGGSLIQRAAVASGLDGTLAQGIVADAAGQRPTRFGTRAATSGAQRGERLGS